MPDRQTLESYPDVIVMARETDHPELRAHLRQCGFFVPPALARTDWGPPAVRIPVEQWQGDEFGWDGEGEPAERPPEQQTSDYPAETGPPLEEAAFSPPPGNDDWEGGPGEGPNVEDYPLPSPGGESTTQASHRIERLDLSDWGYLLRIVMIADKDSGEPLDILTNLRPNVGQWLHDEIDQPARLEYDRRFRRDVEKRLAKFLTESVGRFPIIKADIQYIE